MNDKQLVKTSKYLSLHLRHEPERIGLTLELGGWVRVDDLLAACAAHGFSIERPLLDAVVAGNDKQRFAFDETGEKIRANQGHSVAVDLQLAAAEPPDVLYHGTGERSAAAILGSGLLKMQRHHVHLSSDTNTARNVGARHGKPLIFRVDAAAMRRAGQEFFRSENGVWLTDAVPPQYLALLDGSASG